MEVCGHIIKKKRQQLFSGSSQKSNYNCDEESGLLENDLKGSTESMKRKDDLAIKGLGKTKAVVL